MNTRSPLAAAFSTAATGWERPAFERQIAMLGELAEAGLEVVHAIRDQAVAATVDPCPRIDFGLAYTRAARAVRMTLSLQRRYILDLRFEFRHGEPAPAWDTAPKARASGVDRIRHGLGTGGLGEAKAVKQLDQEIELYERLEDLEDDIPDGSFNEIVAKLCKDLGLAPDWLERTEEKLAEMAADARPPPQSGGGGPLKGVEGAYHRSNVSASRRWRPRPRDPPHPPP
jgi:hypothetical protein